MSTSPTTSTIPNAEHSREAVVGRGKRINLVKLARAQRLLLRFVLGAIAIYLGMPFAINLLMPMIPAPAVILWTMALAVLALGIASIVQTVRLEVAAGGNVVVAVLVGILMLVPLLGLILVAIINGRATGILRKHGARVGFLGVTKDEMRKLTIGCCPMCGYPTAGLTNPTTPICPECGTPIPPESFAA
jgi:hypothetical protein